MVRYFLGFIMFFLVTAAINAAMSGLGTAADVVSGGVPVPTIPQNTVLIPQSRVCMVNNTVFDKPQIPVQVEGKTYYGCCGGCVAQLNNNPSVRYAIDPLTGNKVDKALAFIVLDPSSPNHALYFESNENAGAYLNKNKEKETP